jgi:hypothetical protein
MAIKISKRKRKKKKDEMIELTIGSSPFMNSEA